MPAANVMEMDHRPEFAIPITQRLWVEAKAARSDGAENVNGYAIAVGWDRPQSTTFYLVCDADVARPLWISEAEITASAIRPPDQ